MFCLRSLGFHRRSPSNYHSRIGYSSDMIDNIYLRISACMTNVTGGTDKIQVFRESYIPTAHRDAPEAIGISRHLTLHNGHWLTQRSCARPRSHSVQWSRQESQSHLRVALREWRLLQPQPPRRKPRGQKCSNKTQQ